MITSENKSKFKDSVIVLDDMGDKLIKDIARGIISQNENIIIFK